ncbi:uncharacterized protein LOC114255449 [Monomorium pharaonis]|uniref:uncharacterized protein LOC114255449 n=1 Tax=Monomorium pharaonis TaxID=307658 RepID=UPI00102E1746|nr:uncharacterized protein LOC114255449 [Monomorium pharaonis]XP_036138848.1 uncharacterized protein LOC114255449 [Monomorium pharaonis]
MALTLALPLFGLDPEHFSTLSMKLLNIDCEQNLRNLSDSGRISPSSGSESSGISSLATSAESASVELTPFSSRAETPIKTPCKSQEKRTVQSVRIVYEGRDILNLGANIRSSFDWQMKDRTLSRHNIQDFISNRLIYHRLREQPSIKNYNIPKLCHECEFYEPPSIF